jgi:outer membrane receptor protein involved in Fe transport
LPNPIPTEITVVDPERGNAMETTQAYSGGNPSLRPEKSGDLELGVVFEPESLRGFRVALDWYQIRERDQIIRLSPQTIVDDEAIFPGLVTRSAATPGDPFGVGVITAVDFRLLNLTKLQTNGFDATLDYRRLTNRFGTFAISAQATLTNQFKQQSTFNSPFAEYAGWVDDGGPDRFKGNATLTWGTRRWTISWTTEYFGSYHPYGAPGEPPSGPTPFSTPFFLALGSDHIPGQIYHDIMAAFRFPARKGRWISAPSWLNDGLDGVTIQFGIKDLFNSVPPLDVFDYYAASGASAFGDPRLRDYWISIEKQF